MEITITPQKLTGTVSAIPSKSQAHRLLICAAFSDSPTTLICPDTNQDIEATADCLRAIGTDIQRTTDGYRITPATQFPPQAEFPCRESGSTLRFLLPIAGALGIDSTFHMEGRLGQRPLSPLWEEMERMGCSLSRPNSSTLRCTGKLHPGEYAIDGGVSSQFITGLLFAAALLPGESQIHLLGNVESKPYIDMTRRVMALFGIKSDNMRIYGGQRFHSPGVLTVEGDWSNSAFFLAAKAMGSPVEVTNLHEDSPQGDRAIAHYLTMLQNKCTISAADTPDLVPILGVFAAANQGAVFTDIRRLRLKETDRVATVCAMLNALGITTKIDENSLEVFPGQIRGGTVDATGDHRIAMAAAIAATEASGPVTIIGAESVNKSYPTFWAEYRRLGGNYELNLR